MKQKIPKRHPLPKKSMSNGAKVEKESGGLSLNPPGAHLPIQRFVGDFDDMWDSFTDTGGAIKDTFKGWGESVIDFIDQSDESVKADPADSIGKTLIVTDSVAYIRYKERDFDTDKEIIPKGTKVIVEDVAEHEGKVYAQVKDAESILFPGGEYPGISDYNWTLLTNLSGSPAKKTKPSGESGKKEKPDDDKKKDDPSGKTTLKDLTDEEWQSHIDDARAGSTKKQLYDINSWFINPKILREIRPKGKHKDEQKAVKKLRSLLTERYQLQRSIADGSRDKEIKKLFIAKRADVEKRRKKMLKKQKNILSYLKKHFKKGKLKTWHYSTVKNWQAEFPGQTALIDFLENHINAEKKNLYPE